MVVRLDLTSHNPAMSTGQGEDGERALEEVGGPVSEEVGEEAVLMVGEEEVVVVVVVGTAAAVGVGLEVEECAPVLLPLLKAERLRFDTVLRLCPYLQLLWRNVFGSRAKNYVVTMITIMQMKEVWYRGYLGHRKGEVTNTSTQLALFHRLSDRVLVGLDGTAFLEPVE